MALYFRVLDIQAIENVFKKYITLQDYILGKKRGRVEMLA